jgi:hypothetical protein
MKMALPSSKIHLPKTDVAYLGALRRAAQLLHAEGDHRRAWSYNTELCELINQGTLHALASGDFTSNDLLMFGEITSSYEQAQSNQDRKTIRLKLSLLEGSPLAREIEAVLKKHMKGQEHE